MRPAGSLGSSKGSRCLPRLSLLAHFPSAHAWRKGGAGEVYVLCGLAEEANPHEDLLTLVGGDWGSSDRALHSGAGHLVHAALAQRKQHLEQYHRG